MADAWVGAPLLVAGPGGAFPVSVDLGYRFGERLAVGTSATVGLLPIGGSAVELLAAATVYLAPSSWRRLDPWLSVGAGFETTTWRDRERPAASVNYRGPELLALRAGATVALGENLGLGPVLGVGLGRYSLTSAELNGQAFTEATRYPTLHAWVSLGLRLELRSAGRRLAPDASGERMHASARDYDDALAELRAAESLAQRGRTQLAREHVLRARAMCTRALHFLEDPGRLFQRSYYFTQAAGTLSHEQLIQAHRQLAQRVDALLASYPAESVP